MTAQKKPMTHEEEIAADTAIDYTANMFADGNNRAETNKKVHDAPRYNKAAHTIDPDITSELDMQTSAPVGVAHSRDGTDASGVYDEDGGPLGGTPKELDALEAGGTPVDRNPHMKG